MHHLSADFIEDVYNTVQGNLIPDACIPGVENLFSDGSPCDQAYEQMHNAYQRLLQRLNKKDDDQDVETIIHSMLTISAHVGTAMYLYGAKFALQSACEHPESNQ